MRYQYVKRWSRSTVLASACTVGLFGVGCGSSSSDDTPATVAATTADPAADTGTDSAASSIINIVGSLALTSSSSSSSSSLRLASTADQYWVKCVTLDITNANACIDDTDTSGAFALACDGFKGKQFGCFILQGADQNNLTIKGVITSSDLAASSETSEVSMGISFDPDTGVASANVEVKTEAGVADTAAASVAQTLPAEVSGFALANGVYEFQFCDNFSRDKAAKGDFDPANISDNTCHHRELRYVHVTPAAGTVPPQIELWRSAEARSGCMVNNVLTYSISDGTNTLNLTESTDFDTVFAAIQSNSWASQAALDRLSISQSEIDKKADDTSSGLATAFGTENFCGPMVDKFIEAYNAATIQTRNGFSNCQGVVFNTGSSSFDEELNGPAQDGGPPPEWCVDYKMAPADQKAAVRDRFIVECNLHVKGGDNEALWAKRDMVEPFLRELGESRHRSGNDRFADFKAVWEAIDFDSISTRVNAGTQTTQDDEDLVDLCLELKEVWHDHDRRRIEAACDSIGANVAELTVSGTAFTGRQYLVGKFGSGLQSRQQLEQLACDGEWEFDIRHLTNAELNGTEVTTFMSKLDPPVPGQTQGPIGVTKKNSSEAYTDIVNPLLDWFLDTTTPRVFGCTKTQMTNQKQWMQQTAQCSSDPFAQGCEGVGGGDPNFDPAQQMATQLFYTLQEAKQSVLIRAVKIDDPDQDGNDPFDTCTSDKNCTEAQEDLKALRDSLLAVVSAVPEHTSFLLFSICGLDGSRINSEGGFTIGADTGLTCGGAVPENKSYSHMFGGGPGGAPAGGAPAPAMLTNTGSATFPQAFEGDSRPYLDRLGDLQREAFGFISHESQRFDTTYQDKIREISKESTCLPDATLGRDPVLKAGQSAETAGTDSYTFQLKLRAPVKRIMSSPVNLALAEGAQTVTKFNAAEERLEKEGGGMGSQECVRGEVIRMSNFWVDAGTIYGSFSQAHKDNCFNSGGNNNSSGGNSDSSSGDESAAQEHGWYAFFKATKQADE